MADLKRKVRFWIIGQPEGELVIRLRRWWRRHWWLARIRQIDRERRYWRTRTLDLERVDVEAGAGAIWAQAHPDTAYRPGTPRHDAYMDDYRAFASAVLATREPLGGDS
jgi:hypothetical protein